MTDLLRWLQAFYRSQCDGDWEHTYGLEIGTLDNPGWRLRFDLTDTTLEGAQFATVDIARNADDWVVCRVEENTFAGAGGPENLIELLTIFRDWVEANLPSDA